MKSVYIIGSKGIPAKYGGFETFVEKLTENQKDKNIKYYVACMRENSTKSNITDILNIMEQLVLILMYQILFQREQYYDIAALNKSIEIAKMVINLLCLASYRTIH